MSRVQEPFKDNALSLTISNNIHYRYLLFKGFTLSIIYKFMRNMSHVKLPTVTNIHPPYGNSLAASIITRSVNSADTLTRILDHFTTRKCFFRALTAAYVLRKKGIDVTLNMGLKHLNSKDRKATISECFKSSVYW